MTAKAKKKTLQLVGNTKLDVKKFATRRMWDPVTQKMVTSYGIPLDDIDASGMNPMRVNGTIDSHVQNIYNELITSPDGQEDPGCVEWDMKRSLFDPVYAYTRYHGMALAKENGIAVANSPNYELWCILFSGTPVERLILQLRENGNKKSQAEATANDVALGIEKLAKLGFFDHPGAPFAQCDDKEKRKRVYTFVQANLPKWGGRKFSSVWAVLKKAQALGTGGLGLQYKSWPIKEVIAEYFIAHNPFGITVQDIIDAPAQGKSHKEGSDTFSSGFVLDHGGIRYGFYISKNKTEINGALPTNASKKSFEEKIDKMILLCAFNKSRTDNADESRDAYKRDARYWNVNIYGTFDDMFCVPQTKHEEATLFHKGKWARHDKL